MTAPPWWCAWKSGRHERALTPALCHEQKRMPPQGGGWSNPNIVKGKLAPREKPGGQLMVSAAAPLTAEGQAALSQLYQFCPRTLPRIGIGGE